MNDPTPTPSPPETPTPGAGKNEPAREQTPSRARAEFESSAREADVGLVREFLQFLIENKAWWLVPILLSLLLLGLVVWLSGSGLAPFIYPLF